MKRPCTSRLAVQPLKHVMLCWCHVYTAYSFDDSAADIKLLELRLVRSMVGLVDNFRLFVSTSQSTFRDQKVYT
jgi:hypothetical protein